MKTTEKGRHGECACCGYTTTVYPRRVWVFPTDPVPDEVWYCDVCWGSGISQVARSSDPGTEAIVRSLAYVVNLLLASKSRQ